MNRTLLVQSAGRMAQPSESTVGEFAAAAETVAAELNQQMGARPDLGKLIGEGNRAMMEDNSRNFCRFMAALFQRYQPEVLVDTVLWVFRTYRAHGFQVMYWPANIDTCFEITRKVLSPEACREVQPFYEWLIVNIPAFTAISDVALGEAPQASAGSVSPS